ncbi:MAG: 2-amino-4-hydroxy-6-hydroxymethyldihydropteridine diphosphokinase [Phycisphaerales bacterium]|nr:2-amino-4-hydroxy-6-hydroxymethyldihydropteridine diphosphokinase [Phycisphaerales bacterium]
MTSGRVWIALGTNLGDRHAALDQALSQLGHTLRIEATSSRWETAPVGPHEQGAFLNMVIRAETSLAPADLLSLCLSIESDMGRDRATTTRWGPRIIDLDLLLMSSPLLLEAPGLTLPHPRLHERAFVLAPITQIDPDLVHPVKERTMASLLRDEIQANGPLAGRCERVD